MNKKRRRSTSSDSIATETSDEVSDDGGYAVKAGAAGTACSSYRATSATNGDKRKRILFAFLGLVVVALVVGLSVGLTKRDSDPKGQQETSGTQSSTDKKDIAQDEKPRPSTVGTLTASPTGTTLDYVLGSAIFSDHAKYDQDTIIKVSFVNLEPDRGDWIAIVKVDLALVCDEHTACRCYEDKCAHLGVYETYESILKETCESLCMEDIKCNGIEYNELEQKCESHTNFLTDRKDNADTLCCKKKVSFTSVPIDWKYACGSQSCNEDADSGTVSFDTAALTAGATYEAHLLSKTGFAIKAKTKPFVVVGDGLVPT